MNETIRHRENLKQLITELEAPNPQDPSPKTSQKIAKYLRMLQVAGPEEMVEVIRLDLLAILGAIRVISSDQREAGVVLLVIVTDTIEAWLAGHGDTGQ